MSGSTVYACYAMSGTDSVYGAASTREGGDRPVVHQLPFRARADNGQCDGCDGPGPGIVLRACYAMPGTDVAHAAQYQQC
eukprot:3925745-Rhodomonas_salina.2